MENNNNGRGIFYGVIGVATLVVAIIGATFAYFSASVTRNGIYNVKSTTLSLTIPSEKQDFRTDLIPVKTVGNESIFSRYVGFESYAGKTKRLSCKDDVGNSICSMYEFTVKNPNKTTAQTVVGSMKVSQNTFANLYYAVFKGSDNDIPTDKYANMTTASATVLNGKTGAGQTQADPGTLVVPRTKIEGTGTYNWTNTLETLKADNETAVAGQNNTTTYTLVLWVEEIGSDQTSIDAGKIFAAGVTFTSNTGEGGVTGVISAGGQPAQG